MKKVYIRPAMDCYQLKAQQSLLAGSTFDTSSATEMGSGSFGSRMSDDWDLMLLEY